MLNKYLLILTCLLINACGGSSSSSSGIYDIDSYSPETANDSNLTGTWLFVFQFDVEYRHSHYDENESRHYAQEARSIVHIIDEDDGFRMYSLADCCFGSEFEIDVNYKTDDEISIELNIGSFSGSISNNNFISGTLTDSFYASTETIVSSSKGGFVKLSQNTSLPGVDTIPTSWGNMEYSGHESILPIHGFVEEHFVWEILEDGLVTGSDEIYALSAVSITEDILNLESYEMPDHYRFRFRNNIRSEIYDEIEDEAGWHAYTSAPNSDLSFTELRDHIVPGPLIALSTTKNIIGNHTSNQPPNSSINITVALD